HSRVRAPALFDPVSKAVDLKAKRSARYQLASAFGSGKVTFSEIPPNSLTESAPIAVSLASTASTRTSGADAPAVTPTTFFPSIHSGFRSAASSSMYAGTPRLAATSRSRLELELFG